MIITMMKTHDSSMKIQDKVHVLLTMETSSKSVINSAIQQNPKGGPKVFVQNYGKPTNYKIVETFKSVL